MATGKPWNAREVSAAVEDYMQMLRCEHARETYNKSAHRRVLQSLLEGRSPGSVEMKHQNISAVLQLLGRPWIPGYKPLPAFQGILLEEVGRWLETHPDFETLEVAAVTAAVDDTGGLDFSKVLDSAPFARPRTFSLGEAERFEGTRLKGQKRDYLAQEARNASLGRAGEEFILGFEHHRLWTAGHKKLADKIEHASRERGDGLGYDILSFDEDGRERFIEVKTTRYAKQVPFFASANEVRFAGAMKDQFHLYRVFEFGKATRCYIRQGSLAENYQMEVVSYRCEIA